MQWYSCSYKSLSGIFSLVLLHHESMIMPCKKPSVPKHRHYSRDLKRRVIYQTDVLGLTSTEVSINLDIPLRVVQHVKQTWNEIGEVCRDRTAIGRAPLMQPGHCEVSTHTFMTGIPQSPYFHLWLVSSRSIGAFSRYLPGWAAGAAWRATQHKGFHIHNLQYLEATQNYIQEGKFTVFPHPKSKTNIQM